MRNAVGVLALVCLCATSARAQSYEFKDWLQDCFGPKNVSAVVPPRTDVEIGSYVGKKGRNAWFERRLGAPLEPLGVGFPKARENVAVCGAITDRKKGGVTFNLGLVEKLLPVKLGVDCQKTATLEALQTTFRSVRLDPSDVEKFINDNGAVSKWVRDRQGRGQESYIAMEVWIPEKTVVRTTTDSNCKLSGAVGASSDTAKPGDTAKAVAEATEAVPGWEAKVEWTRVRTGQNELTFSGRTDYVVAVKAVRIKPRGNGMDDLIIDPAQPVGGGASIKSDGFGPPPVKLDPNDTLRLQDVHLPPPQPTPSTH